MTDIIAPTRARLAPPASDTADVWLIRPQDLLAQVSRHPFLAANERATMTNDHARVATRLGLRILLGRYCAVPPADLQIVDGPHGKPELAQSPLSFSVARRGDQALVAVTTAGRVGIDIEEVRPLPELDGIAAMLHPDERAGLDRATEAERQRLFYRIWTRKEAALKAQGVGIALGLDAFSVARGDERISGPRLCPLPDAPALLLHDLALPQGYCGALATDPLVTRTTICALPPLTDALLEADL